jgi:hypothetical protein
LDRSGTRCERYRPRAGRTLADGDVVAALANAVPDNPDLVDLCTHEPLVDRIVLYADGGCWRVELFVWRDGYRADVHAHRRSRTSRLLAGLYTLTIHTVDEQRRAWRGPGPKAALIQVQEPGRTHTLLAGAPHTVDVHGDVAGLQILGPAVPSPGRDSWAHQRAADMTHASNTAAEQHVRAALQELRAAGVLPG